jgi:DNA helicase-2/ATP-dependent DNA helicase PcrA
MTSRIGNPDTPADLKLRSCLDSEFLISFVMVAGAGSGKTTSLVKALSHIASKRGVTLRRLGQKVACITYTDIATSEIASDVGHDPLFHVSTIHSFLWTVIKPFQTDIKAWVTARIEEKLNELNEKQRTAGARTKAATLEKLATEITRYEKQKKAITNVSHFTYGTGSDYAAGVLGHSDIIKMATSMLIENPLLRTLVAQKYPFVFVDESQDTVPRFVEALMAVDAQMGSRFCLGFFGDPMQKIYAEGVGDIAKGDGWEEITKPENFRCPTNVLSVINAIRAIKGDLVQTGGRQINTNGKPTAVPGTARLFVFPIDAERQKRIHDVRAWIAKQNNDPLWTSDKSHADVKVMVIAHRMAAVRLGFVDLYSALHDQAPSKLKDSLLDGKAWPVRLFLSFVLPIVAAFRGGRDFEVMELLRAQCPLLSRTRLNEQVSAALLTKLEHKVSDLSQLLEQGSGKTVGEILRFVHDSELATLDDRFITFLNGSESAAAAAQQSDQEEDTTKESAAVAAFLMCHAEQLWGYRLYVENESPFSTQQGIKGAEFTRVLTVLDDDEGTHTHFSYDRYFDLVPANESEIKNIAEKKDTVVDRTRRLLYVCCSRAMQDLAVVLFTSDPAKAAGKIRQLQIFARDNIHTLADMTN